MFGSRWEVDDEQLTVLKTVELAAGRVFAEQCAALLSLYEDTDPGNRVGQRPHVLAEAGVALGLHPQTVESRLGVAMTLRTHPLLEVLLRSGGLGVPHALAAADEADALGDDDLAGLVLQEVLLAEGRIGWTGTPAQLRTALRRRAVQADPAAAARRREQQLTARAGVRLRPLPDGIAALVATGAADQISAADHLLRVLSGPAGPDDERTSGQRQIDALLAALAARAGTGVALELQLEIPVTVTSSTDAPVDPEPLTIQAQLTPELLAVLDASTSQSHVEQAGADLHDTTPTATATDETPAPTGHDQPAARRHQPRRGVPELLGHGPVDPARLAELLDPRGLPLGLRPVTLRRVCVDPTGQVVAVDARAVPLARLGTCGTGLAGLLASLTRGLPPPPPRVERHRPTADQTRVVRARDHTCQFPGCRRRARRAELDHRRRHPDGPTSVSNLHALCKHHHRLKHDGWTCRRHPDGTTTWVSPRGHRATTQPP